MRKEMNWNFFLSFEVKSTKRRRFFRFCLRGFDSTRPCPLQFPRSACFLAALPPLDGENRSRCQPRRGQWAFSATGGAQRKGGELQVPSLASSRSRASILLAARPRAASRREKKERSLTLSRPSLYSSPPQMPALAALGAVHSAYVVLLRSLISLAIFLSVACSADRVFKVAVHLKHKLREMLTGKRPEHDFSCRPLPDPASYALVFPKVSLE